MNTRDAISPELNRIGKVVVDSAFRVHSEIGPGLLESIYEACFAHEIAKRSVAVGKQAAMPIGYDGVTFESGLRLDLLIEESVIVAVKAVEWMLPVFEAQVLSYLKLAKCRLGHLINFNVPLIREGIRRYARQVKLGALVPWW